MPSNNNKKPGNRKVNLDKIGEQIFLIQSKLAVLEKAALYVADECRDDSGLDEHLYLCIKDINDTYAKLIHDLHDAAQEPAEDLA